ncbi:MAG TPA: hypothetical protein VJT54_05395 [Verrucomicrobiae bacterium]|nr:hypothetical protein [Verrucomicrobiae bacterium]
MKYNADNELLLNDVLAEATPPDFRGAILDQTLGLARRRRRWGQIRRVAGIFTVLGLLGFFVWQKDLPRQASMPMNASKTIEKSYTLVRTQPLPAGEVVATRPLTAGRFIVSTLTVGIVQTGRGNYRLINDNELLALLTSHPAALVRTGPHSEQLIFANPEDEKGFPLN